MRTWKKKLQQGSIAMVMVLVTLALVTSVVLEVMSFSQVSATVVSNHRDAEKAYQLARAAVRWSFFRLQLDSSLDRIPAIPGTNYGGKKDDLSEFQWAVSIPYPFNFGVPTEEEAVSETFAPEGIDIGGTFTSTLYDESAKININDVLSAGIAGRKQWSAATEIFENLLVSLRFQPYFKNKDHRELLWAIDDWTDSDSQVNHLGGGIEDIEYQDENNSNIGVKNGPFYSVEELRLLKPMKEELFQELKPFITVYPFNAQLPRMSTMLPTPLGKINVNTAPLELIAALFSRAVMPEEQSRLQCAQTVAQYRQNIAFRSKNEFIRVVQESCNVGGSQASAFSSGVKGILSVRSDLFSIEAIGMAGKMEKTIHAVVSRQRANKPQIFFWKVI